MVGVVGGAVGSVLGGLLIWNSVRGKRLGWLMDCRRLTFWRYSCEIRKIWLGVLR